MHRRSRPAGRGRSPAGPRSTTSDARPFWRREGRRRTSCPLTAPTPRSPRPRTRDAGRARPGIADPRYRWLRQPRHASSRRGSFPVRNAKSPRPLESGRGPRESGRVVERVRSVPPRAPLLLLGVPAFGTPAESSWLRARADASPVETTRAGGLRQVLTGARCSNFPEQPVGHRPERRELLIGVGADAEAVVDIQERQPALARGGLIAGSVANEDRLAETVALDQRREVARLGEAGVAPALGVTEAITESRPVEEALDVAGLAVAHDEERIAGSEATEPVLDVGVEHSTQLGDHPVVFDLGLFDEGEHVRLGHLREHLADALVVRLARNPTHVVFGDLAEANAVTPKHAVPRDGARRARVPQRAIQIEDHRVDRRPSPLPCSRGVAVAL